MDSERQPLLNPVTVRAGAHCSRFRPLTHEEVLHARQEITWRRARFFLVLMFWAIMAMFLSMIACILVTAPKCSPYDVGLGPAPAIPPVHMTFAPLISSGRALAEDVYTF